MVKGCTHTQSVTARLHAASNIAVQLQSPHSLQQYSALVHISLVMEAELEGMLTFIGESQAIGVLINNSTREPRMHVSLIIDN